MPRRFPPLAETDPYGMLLEGGKLDPDWVLEAYDLGIFPWPVCLGWRGQSLTWWSPDPRAILDFDDFYVSRRLARRIRSGKFQVTFNRDFDGVIEGCAAPRPDAGGTWITSDMLRVYKELHRMGRAHSVEVWEKERLVGGLYGVSVGGSFSAESMFKRERDASKVALYYLIERLRERQFILLDVQQWTEHTGSLGAKEIPRREFLERLEAALQLAPIFDSPAGPA